MKFLIELINLVLFSNSLTQEPENVKEQWNIKSIIDI